MAETAPTLDTNAYCGVADLQQHLDLTRSSGAHNELIVRAVNAASRQVDQFTNRRFYVDTSATARVFAARSDCWVRITDASRDSSGDTTITAVETDTAGTGSWTAWTTGDYQLEPLNGVKNGLEDWPAEYVRAVATRRFPVSREARVRVTAKWGFGASVPDAVVQATAYQAAFLFEGRKAAEGVAGFDGFGVVRFQNEIDRRAQALLAPYVLVAMGR